MRYDSTWLQNRIDSIHSSVKEDTQLKDLRFSGNGMAGYQIYLYLGGPIKVIQQGTLRECLAYLDGILFTLTSLNTEQ